MEGTIYLVKIKNDKIVPALLLGTNKQGRIIIAQLRTSSKKDTDRVIPIGHPKGLKSDSVVMPYRVYSITNNDIIKELATIDYQKVRDTIDKYNKDQEIKKLHAELHELKNKIILAKFHNEDYTAFEKKLGYVMRKLGYKRKYSHAYYSNKPQKCFGGFRVAPSKGYMKIYHGGR